LLFLLLLQVLIVLGGFVQVHTIVILNVREIGEYLISISRSKRSERRTFTGRGQAAGNLAVCFVLRRITAE
jgi:hypothetical protein